MSSTPPFLIILYFFILFFNSVCFHILLTASTQYHLKYFTSFLLFCELLFVILHNFILRPFLLLCFSFSSIPFSCLYKIFFFKVFLAYQINTWERTVSVIDFPMQPTAASRSPGRFACSRKSHLKIHWRLKGNWNNAKQSAQTGCIFSNSVSSKHGEIAQTTMLFLRLLWVGFFLMLSQFSTSPHRLPTKGSDLPLMYRSGSKIFRDCWQLSLRWKVCFGIP